MTFRVVVRFWLLILILVFAQFLDTLYRMITFPEGSDGVERFLETTEAVLDSKYCLMITGC